MRYPMTTKTEQSKFKYLVRAGNGFDYYLYNDLGKALNKACALSMVGWDDYYIHEVMNIGGQYRSIVTYICNKGRAEYDEFAVADLHICFYINAGEWLNPNEKLEETVML